MTTATRRLRRASIAGLATIAATGLVVASAGTALAAFSGTTATLTGGGTGNVYPGQTAQALPNAVLTLTNGTWSSGDFFTFELSSSATAAVAVCNTSANLNDSAKLSATPTYTAVDSGGATVAAGTITPEASGTCNGNDEFQFALPASPSDTGTTAFTFSGLAVSLGSAVPTSGLYLTATASNGTAVPFTGASTHASLQEATISSASLTATSVGVSGTTSVDTTLGALKVTDVTGGQVTDSTHNGNLVFTLTTGSDTWASIGTLTAPSGVTVGTGTFSGAVLTYPLTGATPAGGVYTLTGASANINAGTAGAHSVAVTRTAATTNALPALSAQIAYAGSTTREGGADRYATAAQLFNSEFGASPTANTTTTTYAPATSVVVTSGANYPDALSSAYLAGSLNTGILLTDPNVLSQSAKTVLTNGHINTVYIVGGTAAVSQNVQNAIQALFVGNTSTNGNLTVIRLAGADRYATNYQVVLNGGVSGSTSGNTAIIATGANYADALAAGPAASHAHLPLILTTPNALSSTASSAIAALGVTHAIIVGGTSAVSAAVETALGTAGVTVDLRLGGADRTATAAIIGEWEAHATNTAFTTGSYTTGHAGLGFSTTTVNLARGDNYPDALAAGPVLGAVHTGLLSAPVAAPQVLLLSATPTTLGAGVPSFFGNATYSTTVINGIGLASALSGAVLGAALGDAS
ncbi:MAG TPA: cell wall-binding repeat-containing protein [Acidothermaceae bacterium]